MTLYWIQQWELKNRTIKFCTKIWVLTIGNLATWWSGTIFPSAIQVVKINKSEELVDVWASHNIFLILLWTDFPRLSWLDLAVNRLGCTCCQRHANMPYFAKHLSAMQVCADEISIYWRWPATQDRTPRKRPVPSSLCTTCTTMTAM